jgi:DNA (cytosine-5)-methyltransferase 1
MWCSPPMTRRKSSPLCWPQKKIHSNGMAHINSTNDGLRELALFAGAGGGILGGKLLGWRTVCTVEWEPYPAAVLARRQDEGFLPPFPIWDDVQTFDGKPWRGLVDVVSGGFPCQDISSAGKGAGIAGERSGMWKHMARIIGEVRPRYAFVENSPVLTSRGLASVLGDLAALGYDAEWGVLGASHAGAPHQRERIWILAADPIGDQQPRTEPRLWEAGRMGRELESIPWDGGWETALGLFRGMDDGMARSVDRTDAIRNGQVPAVVRLAWRTLFERLMSR